MQNYKKRSKNLHSSKKGYNFAPQNRNNGSLAEWLGTGLQNRLQRFESARNLKRVYSIGSLFLHNGPHNNNNSENLDKGQVFGIFFWRDILDMQVHTGSADMQNECDDQFVKLNHHTQNQVDED